MEVAVPRGVQASADDFGVQADADDDREQRREYRAKVRARRIVDRYRRWAQAVAPSVENANLKYEPRCSQPNDWRRMRCAGC